MTIALLPGSVYNSTSGTVTAVCPGGVVTGNLMLAYVAALNNGTINAPTGWTRLGTQLNQGTGLTATLFYKFATSSDISNTTTYAFTNTVTGSNMSVNINGYSGVLSSTTLAVNSIGGAAGSTGTGSATYASIAKTVGNLAFEFIAVVGASAPSTPTGYLADKTSATSPSNGTFRASATDTTTGTAAGPSASTGLKSAAYVSFSLDVSPTPAQNLSDTVAESNSAAEAEDSVLLKGSSALEAASAADTMDASVVKAASTTTTQKLARLRASQINQPQEVLRANLNNKFGARLHWAATSIAFLNNAPVLNRPQRTAGGRFGLYTAGGTSGQISTTQSAPILPGRQAGASPDNVNFTFIIVASNVGAGSTIYDGQETGGNWYNISRDSSGNLHYSDGTNNVIGAPWPSSDIFIFHNGKYDNTITPQAWADGIAQPTTQGTPNDPGHYSSSPVFKTFFGSTPYNGGNNFSGQGYAVIILRGLVTQGEVDELTANPWQVFQSQAIPLFRQSSGAVASTSSAISLTLRRFGSKKRQPTQALQIDWANPLTNGLAIVIHPAQRFINLVDGSQIGDGYSPGASWYNTVNATGIALGNNNATNYRIGAADHPVSQTGYTSAVIVTMRANITNGAGLISSTQPNFYQGAEIFVGDGTNPRFGLNCDNGSHIVAPSNYVLGKPTLVVASVSGSQQYLGIDGAVVGSANYGVSWLYGSPHSFTLYSPSNTRGDCEVSLAVMWARPLSPAEIASFGENPWQLFKSSRRPTFLSAARVAQSYSTAIAEAMTASDQLAALYSGIASATETASLADALISSAVRPAAIAESGSASDVSSQTSGAIMIASEVATASDSLGATAAFAPMMMEAVTATDTPGASVVSGSTAMTSVARPIRRVSKSAPDNGRIDWSNPLARGTNFLMLPNMYDVVSGSYLYPYTDAPATYPAPFSSVGTLGRQVTIDPKAGSPMGTSQTLSLPAGNGPSGLFDSGNGGTAHILIRPLNNPSSHSYMLLNRSDSNDSTGWSLYWDGVYVILLMVGASGNGGVRVAATMQAGVPVLISVTQSRGLPAQANTVTLYMNGRFVGQGTDTSVTGIHDSDITVPFYIGSGIFPYGPLQGDILFCSTHSREHSAAEVWQMYTNPWQLIEAQAARTFIGSASAVSTGPNAYSAAIAEPVAATEQLAALYSGFGNMSESASAGESSSNTLTSGAGGTWQKVANENETYTGTPGTQVRYGCDPNWAYGTIPSSGTIVFNNVTFGDPAPGYLKEGDIYIPASNPTAYDVDVAEVIAATEQLAALYSGFGNTAETAALIDATSGTRATFAFGSESATAADAQASTSATNCVASEVASAADTSSNTVGGATSSVTESSTAADAPSSSTVAIAARSESATAIDAPAASYVTSSSAAEAGSASDALASTKATSGAATEASAATDSGSALQASNNSASEAGSASDSLSANYATSSAATEAGSAADATSSSKVATGSATEAGSAADALGSVASVNAATAESSTASDTSAPGTLTVSSTVEASSAVDQSASSAAFVSSASESNTAVDAPVAVFVTSSAATEAGAAADISSYSTGSTMQVNDAASAADSVMGQAAFNAASTNASTASESVASSTQATAAATEPASASDTSANSAVEVANATESAVSADSSAYSSGTISTQAESANAADSVVSQAAFNAVSANPATAAESIAATEQTNAATAEASSATELSATSGLTVMSANEPANSSDSASGTMVTTLTQSDAASAADSLNSVAAQGAAVNEATTGTDMLAATSAFATQTLESVIVVDTVGGSKVSSSAISEAVATLDSVDSVRSYVAALAEIAGMSDASGYQVFYNGFALEAATATDVPSVRLDYSLVVLEAANAIDYNYGSIALKDLRQFPLDGLTMSFPLQEQDVTYPLQGKNTDYPLE